MMQIYNAKIRLNGEMANEVAKRGLTVPEVLILRRLHGGRAGVVALEHVGYAEVDSIDERERLEYEYDAGLKNLGEDLSTSVEKMFPGEYAELPQELRDYEGELADEDNIKALIEWQAALPFQSPNAEDKASLIRKKAEAKALSKRKRAERAGEDAPTGKKAVKPVKDANPIDAMM